MPRPDTQPQRATGHKPTATRLATITFATAAIALGTFAGPVAATFQPQLQEVLDDLTLREIGPAIMGGRVADLAPLETDPSTFYVGFGSAGVWRTDNNGMSWTPLFDDQPCSSVGDVTVFQPNPNVVWVGTGEPQNRQSSQYGCGVFKSTDGGKSWMAKGLADSRHIARIAVHPRDPEVAYVAAVGHLFGPNEQRGVFRTTDGGDSWERVLYVDEHTGAIDLVMDPSDPRTLFAAMYQRQRTVFGFSAGGSGSGLYRTTDGGDSWNELTEGLPAGDKGRIGIDIYRRDGNLIYALVESRGQGRGLYRSRDRGDSWEKVSGRNPRPMYFSMVRIDPNNPERIYLGGVRFSASDDGGKSWWDGDAAEGIHVDHHALWIDPENSDHLILGNDGGVATSFDGARTWRHHNNMAIGQFYEVGVDMSDPYRICGGLQDNSSWCAPNETLTSQGLRNGDWYDVWGGDGFYNQFDPENPNILYTESQGGNSGRVNLATGEVLSMRPTPAPEADVSEEERRYRYNWNAPIVVSRHDSRTVYVGNNHLMRSRDRGLTWDEASPDLTRQIDRDTLAIMGELVTDEILSRHDGVSTYGNITTVAESPLSGQVIYVGTDDGNLQVTRDGGASWVNVVENVPDLPERSYVSRIEASHHAPGRLYATFDRHWDDDYAPYVYVSEDFGASWRKVTDGLPDWSVNVIREHPVTEGLLFLGNENGVFVWVGERGQRWHRLNGLPTVPVDDLVIHPRDNDLIIGTHGRSIWILDDLAPLEELAAGRVVADGAHLFPVAAATLRFRLGGWPFAGDVFEAENPPDGAVIRYWMGERGGEEEGADGADDRRGGEDGGDDGGGGEGGEGGEGGGDDGDGDSRGKEGDEVTSSAQITISTLTGDAVRSLTASADAGMNQVVWDLREDPPVEIPPAREGGPGGGGFGFGGAARGPLVLPGEYSIALEVDGEVRERTVWVRMDPRVDTDIGALRERQAAARDAAAISATVTLANRAIRRMSRQIADARELLEEAEADADLIDVADLLTEELDSLRVRLQRASPGRAAAGIERNAGPPSTQQSRAIDHAWAVVPGLVEEVNSYVTERLPEFHKMIHEAEIRPATGDAVVVPRRRGGVG